MKLFDATLYLWDKDIYEDEYHIVALDISNPENIQQLFEITLKDQDLEIESLIVHQKKIFAVGSGGLYEVFRDGESQLLFESEDIMCDIIAHENILITSGDSDGIRIFELANELILKKHIAVQFVIPTALSWAEKGKTLLVLGNKDESVMKIDVSIPEKAKRTKAAKTGIGLCAQYAKSDDDCLLVLGTAINSRNHNPKICEVDIFGELPGIRSTMEIVDYKPKDSGGDAPRGIFRIGNYIILATYCCQLGVVEIV
jgi:hypothetical protein